MSEVINREVTENYVIYTLDDGTTRQAPREFIETFQQHIWAGMSLLEAKGHSIDEAGIIIKEHIRNMPLT